MVKCFFLTYFLIGGIQAHSKELRKMMIWIKLALLPEGKGFFALSWNYAILAKRARCYRNQEARHEKTAHRNSDF